MHSYACHGSYHILPKNTQMGQSTCVITQFLLLPQYLQIHRKQGGRMHAISKNKEALVVFSKQTGIEMQRKLST